MTNTGLVLCLVHIMLFNWSCGSPKKTHTEVDILDFLVFLFIN